MEELLQEQIYDESDKMEQNALRLAKWASKEWKNYVKRRKKERGHPDFSMGDVVEQAMARQHDEKTALLGGGDTNSDRGGIFSLFAS